MTISLAIRIFSKLYEFSFYTSRLKSPPLVAYYIQINAVRHYTQKKMWCKEKDENLFQWVKMVYFLPLNRTARHKVSDY